jgi:protein-tyrosine-phosphatase
VDTRNDYPADEKAIAVAEAKGIDLGGHRTSTIQSLQFRENDLFIAMEPWQAEYLVKEYGVDHRCSLLGLWGSPVCPHIQDPHGAPKAYFDSCFSYIEKSVYEVARKIKEAG